MGERSGTGTSGHVVVVGGSMAGLLAARVLADHFGHVTIVDRDRFPDGPAFRPGAPQSRHLHALLARGQELMEGLFPGLVAELTDAGAVLIAWPADALSLAPSGWTRRFPTDQTPLSMSRHLLEWAIRRRVAALGHVRFLEGCEAIGLLSSQDQRAARGVRLRYREPADRADRAHGGGTALPPDEELAADLIVDASGRDSHAPRWLQALGYDAPPESRVNAFLGYATRFYRPPRGFTADWRALFLRGVAPRIPRGGALFPIEGDRWIVTLGGYGRDYPPTDEAGFLEYARSLRSRVLYDAIKDAEPLSPIYGYRRTDNQLRHYDRLDRWPERFVVIGDAVCAFNPIYGQGMTVAALEAAALAACLRDQRRRPPAGDLRGLAQQFQQRVGTIVATPWLVATGEDRRFPTTEGPRPNPATRLVQRYMDRVVAVATEDPQVFGAFSDVVNMLAPPRRLFRPAILRRVLAGLKEPHLVEPPARLGSAPAPSSFGATAETTAAGLDGALSAVGTVDGYAALGAVRLHYVEAGKGPLVVLLHGFPEFWYSWRHQIPALASAGFQVVAPDMRGYNLSDKPRGVGAYALDALVEDVAQLIRDRGAARAVVVGHDWGGGVAWAFAMRHPEMLERLAVLNCPHPARFFDGLRTLRQLRKSWYMLAFQLPGVPEMWLRSGDYAFLRRALRAEPLRRDAFDATDVERYVAALSQPGAVAGGINYYRALFRQRPGQARAAFRPIEAPVLVVWGERDPYLGAELAEPDPALVPDVRVERLPEASHWVQNDQPERVNALLLDFLADLNSAKAAA